MVIPTVACSIAGGVMFRCRREPTSYVPMVDGGRWRVGAEPERRDALFVARGERSLNTENHTNENTRASARLGIFDICPAFCICRLSNNMLYMAPPFHSTYVVRDVSNGTCWLHVPLT